MEDYQFVWRISSSLKSDWDLNHIWLRNTLRERLHYLPRGNRVLSLLPLHTTGAIQCYRAFCYKEGSNTVLSHELLFRAEFPKHLRVWVYYYGLCGKQRICTLRVGARVYYVKLYYIGWILIYRPAKSDNYGRYIVRIPTESVLFSPTELPGFRHSRNHIYLSKIAYVREYTEIIWLIMYHFSIISFKLHVSSEDIWKLPAAVRRSQECLRITNLKRVALHG